jgi:hypothetical protein
MKAAHCPPVSFFCCIKRLNINISGMASCKSDSQTEHEVIDKTVNWTQPCIGVLNFRSVRVSDFSEYSSVLKVRSLTSQGTGLSTIAKFRMLTP